MGQSMCITLPNLLNSTNIFGSSASGSRWTTSRRFASFNFSRFSAPLTFELLSPISRVLSLVLFLAILRLS